MDNLTVIIPYYNGNKTIVRLLESIPDEQPVILVDDLSDETPEVLLKRYPNLGIMRMKEKGYFSGAVNAGIEACNTDVLILNQDAVLEGGGWVDAIRENNNRYAFIGERIAGQHPAYPTGYIHGTLMYLRRDLINAIGYFNEKDYPLWGATCEYQLRACRAGFEVLPMRPFPGLVHDRSGRFGSAIQEVLGKEPERRNLFIRTPPEISIIVPCHNYGRYLPDLVNSFCGGETSLGYFEPQTFASFEIIIVDDASTDDTPLFCAKVASDWKGVFIKRLKKNIGTAAAINAGIQDAHGKYMTIMGADDMRESWALESLYRVVVERPDNYVYDQILAFADGQRRSDINVRVRPFNPVDLIHRNHVHAGIMMPKQAWYQCGGYPETMHDGREDWAMNVNLLAHGWCGIFVDSSGYLYRREKQNRTLHNTTREHWQLFKSKIMQMFPELYDGSVNPMSCCGGGHSSRKSIPHTATKQQVVAGGAGTTVLRYLGQSSGKQTFYGPVTGARYSAGKTHPLIPVDNRDLYGPDQRRLGMLERRENGVSLFKVEKNIERPVPQEAPKEAPVENAEVPASEEFSDWKDEPQETPAPEPDITKTTQVDISKLTLAEIKKLEMTPENWAKLAGMEAADRNRKNVIAFAKARSEV